MKLSSKPDENPSSFHAKPMDANTFHEFVNCSLPLIIDLTQNYINFLEAIKINLNIKLTAKLVHRHLKLYTESDDFQKFKDYLSQNEIAFQAISPAEEHPFKVALKGLPHDTPENIILNSLKDIGFSPISAEYMKNCITKL